MTTQEIQKIILREAYIDRFSRDERPKINNIAEKHGIERDLVHKVAHSMFQEHLLESSSIGSVVITSNGILIAEEEAIPPDETVKENERIRTQILDYLQQEYDKSDTGMANERAMASELAVDQNLLRFNLWLLRDCALVDIKGGGYLHILPEGTKRVVKWRDAIISKDQRVTLYMETFIKAYRERLSQYHEDELKGAKGKSPEAFPFATNDRFQVFGVWAHRLYVYVFKGEPSQRGPIDVHIVDWTGDEEAVHELRDIPYKAKHQKLQEALEISDKPYIYHANWTLFTEDQAETAAVEIAKQAADNDATNYRRAEKQPTLADPPELTEPLRGFRADHPDSRKVAFIVMQFTDSTLHEGIFKTVKDTLFARGITGVRADGKDYADDLLVNVKTYMHGCAFGIAIFERLIEDDFNPNVSLEVGYMMALGKRVCLLKDQNLKTLQSDLTGRLYEPFDTQRPETLKPHLEQWMKDRDLL